MDHLERLNQIMERVNDEVLDTIEDVAEEYTVSEFMDEDFIVGSSIVMILSMLIGITIQVLMSAWKYRRNRQNNMIIKENSGDVRNIQFVEPESEWEQEAESDNRSFISAEDWSEEEHLEDSIFDIEMSDKTTQTDNAIEANCSIVHSER